MRTSTTGRHPEPTKTPSMPSCIIIAASAGVATPPAEKLTTGRRPASAVCLTSAKGAWIDLAKVNISSSSIVLSCRISLSSVRAWRTASTTSPVPASPLVRIMAAPSAIRRSASPRLRQPQTKGTLSLFLFTWLSSSAIVSTWEEWEVRGDEWV